ncbi:dynamin family protein [uncultured Brachyspira sp.]|uniref:dynamin family protein n=1 Tax=uncultured Brachyspira sp. TaxID=221953 RepID=UPI00262ACE53|nr:dynamin family protein [uncultured Brachyspira sp.]
MNTSLILYSSFGIVIIVLLIIIKVLNNKNKKLIQTASLDNNYSSDNNDNPNNYENKILSLKKELENRDLTIKKLNSDIKDQNEKLYKYQNIDSQLLNKDNEIKKLKEELEEKEDEIEDIEDDIEELKDKNRELEEDLNDTESDLYEQKKKNEELNNEKEKEKRKREKEEKIKKEIESLLNSISVILSSKPEDNDNLYKYKELYNEYLNHLKRYNNISGIDIYNVFLNTEKELYDISLNAFIYKKNIVAVGGGFSSGKSSFLNSLIEDKSIRLPTDIKALTYIPSYIFNSDNNNVSVLSLNDNKININIDIFEKLTKRIVNVENLNFNSKNLIKHFFIATTLKKEYQNICFIDTPGYDPGNDDNEEDKKMAFEYIKHANNLLWLINIQAGTISKTDLAFLNEIIKHDKNKKIYVLLTHADTRDDETIRKVIKHIKETLDQNNIKIIGISPYTSSQGKYDDNKQIYEAFTIGRSLPSFLKNMENKENSKLENIKKDIKNIFDSIISKYNEEIKSIKSEITVVNKIRLDNMINLDTKDIIINNYKSYLPEDFKLEANINLKEKNIDKYKDIDKTIYNIINKYQNNIKMYNECISYSKKMLLEIENCVNEIFDL